MALIDREELYKEICRAYEYEYPTTSGAFDEFVSKTLKNIIYNAPIVDAEPVRHGKWIVWNGMDIPENHGRHKCSECGEFAIKPKYGEEILTKRCLNCGARMEGE